MGLLALFGQKPKLRCPICKSTNIRRSTRRGVLEEEILPWIHAYPYRCRECDNRFFRHFRSHEDMVRQTRQLELDAKPKFDE